MFKYLIALLVIPFIPVIFCIGILISTCGFILEGIVRLLDYIDKHFYSINTWSLAAFGFVYHGVVDIIFFHMKPRHDRIRQLKHNLRYINDMVFRHSNSGYWVSGYLTLTKHQHHFFVTNVYKRRIKFFKDRIERFHKVAEKQPVHNLSQLF